MLVSANGCGVALAVGPAMAAPCRTRRHPAPGQPPSVLTLWAAVVAGRLGHPPDTAITLGAAVVGTAARAKAGRLGLAENHRRKKTSAEAATLAGRPAPSGCWGAKAVLDIARIRKATE